MADHDRGELLVVVGVLGVAALAGFLVLRRSSSCPSSSVPIQLQAQGPGTICGGGGCTHDPATTSPAPGHQFVRFQGPGGVSTSQNPFTQPSWVAGFVQAVFQ